MTTSPHNRTPDGELACCFGTRWLQHWDTPTGTGRGCARCDAETHGRADAPQHKKAQSFDQLVLPLEGEYVCADGR